MGSIAFEDYLSDDRKIEIAEAAFRDICEENFRKDSERIFSNAAHEIVWAEVDKIIDGDLAALIAEKTKGAITKLDTYTVFRAKSVYDREESPGYQKMREAVERHQERIASRIVKMADEITKQDVLEAITDGDFNFKLSLT